MWKFFLIGGSLMQRNICFEEKLFSIFRTLEFLDKQLNMLYMYDDFKKNIKDFGWNMDML